jgi:hypothetical protein
MKQQPEITRTHPGPVRVYEWPLTPALAALQQAVLLGFAAAQEWRPDDPADDRGFLHLAEQAHEATFIELMAAWKYGYATARHHEPIPDIPGDLLALQPGRAVAGEN